MRIKKIILIWIICLSPFFAFITLMYLVKINTIKEFPIDGKRDSEMIYFSDLENPTNKLSTIVYSSDGVILGEYFEENRSNVHYLDISPVLIDALISTEDIRFRQHSGIDIRSLFRATYGALSGNTGSGGASTITQQLSKMLFTKQPSSGFERIKQKLKEWVVAIELEKRYSKSEIIEMYLNRFDWINQAVGISSASKIYFNTKVEKITTNQSAMLVGMLKNPSLYNPIRNPEGTQNRRNVVLSQMMKNKKLSRTEFDSLKALPLGLDFQKTGHNEGSSTYFREQLREMLKKWCSTHKKPNGEYYNLYTDGLKVYTTIDLRIQKHAEQAVKNHLKVLQREFNKVYKNSKTPYPRDFSKQQIDGLINQAVKRSERYRKLKNQGKSDSEIENIFNTKVNTYLFSWKGEIDTLISPRDSVIYNKFFLHTGVMSMDPNTGHVKAYVGGINHKYFQYDHVLQGKRQVGSTFKPFLYSLAIQEGMEPCDKILNSPVIFNKDEWNLQEDWIPKNSSDDFDELKLSLKFGLANSLNIMTSSIMHEYGPQAVIDIAQKMGVTSNLQASPSICLGTFDMSVKEITAAYSTFVNNGNYTEPLFITKITDKDGNVLEEFTIETKKVLSDQTAAIMVELLKGVVQGVRSEKQHLIGDKKGKKIGTRGTGVSLRSEYYPYKIKAEIGGKTGTTQNYSDGWFVGITPNLVTAVWVGCEDRAAHFTNKKGYGSHTALPIFGKFMRKIYDDVTITNVTEQDIFEYDIDIKNYIEEKMNCDEIEAIIFDEDINEDF
ncbi:MAG: penicillin-binding protein [Flavobacteriales bacterium]|nr:penicillin-binding protein [Flavobacteriales bacterium]